MENLNKETKGNQYEELLTVLQEQQQIINKFKVSDFYNHLDWCWKIINSECKYLPEEFKREQAEVFIKLLTPQKDGAASESR